MTRDCSSAATWSSSRPTRPCRRTTWRGSCPRADRSASRSGSTPWPPRTAGPCRSTSRRSTPPTRSWARSGSIRPMPLAEALADGGGVAEPALLARLGLAVGDSVKVGETSIRIRAVLLREPDRVGGLFSLGPRLLVGRATLDAAQVLLPGALARYEYKLTLPEGTDAAAVRRRAAAELAGRRLARAQPARRPAPGHPRHRPAGDLPDPGRPHRAAQRRPGHRAHHRDAPRTAHRDHRHAQEPGRLRRAGVHDLPGAGDAARGRRRRAGLGFGPAAAAGGAARARRRAADRARSRRLCRAAAARGAGGAAHHLRVRGLAPGGGARGVAGPLVSGAGDARAPLAAPALSGDAGRGRAGAGCGGDPGRAAARDRRLVRAHRGRGRTPALGPHPPVAARRQPVPASRRVRPAPRRSPTCIGRARPRRG